MSAEWKRVKLDDVCAADKRQGMHVGFPYVGLEDIESHTGRFIGSHTPRAVKSSTFRFSPEHVLYGRLRPYLNKVCAPDFTGHCSTEIIPLRPNPGLSRAFLVYWFLRQETVARIDASTTGARMPRASVDDVLELPLAAPPLAEQQRIVGILDEAFAGIAAARANAEQNLRNARALFESHLQSVFTQRDPSQVERVLGDVCEEITVGHVGSMAKQYKDRGVPFLRSQNIRPFRVVLDNLVFIDEAFNRSLAKSRLVPGDLAIVRTGYPGTAAVVPDSLPVSNCSDLVIVRSGPSVDPHYLALFFNSAHGKALVAGRLVGAAQKHFNITAARQVAISIPALNEQRRVVAKLHTFSKEIERLENAYRRKLAALDELKQSLLHHAFTGQLTARTLSTLAA